MRKVSRFLVMSLLAAGCGGDDGADPAAPPTSPDPGKVVDAGAPDAASDDKSRPDPNAPPATQGGNKLYTVRFDSRAGDQPFACGKRVALGNKATMAEPIDMRFFVHDVALVRANGEKVPLALFQDERYQRENVALLDFADDTGKCATGDADLRTVVHGYAPEQADYTGVAFKIGIPADKNHLNAADAPAPYNVSGLWWSWAGGYKYARIDLTTDPQPVWYFHGGATDCGGSTTTGFTCGAVNLVNIELPNYDPAASLVVFDAARFYANSDLTVGDQTPGCMGFAPDDQCQPLYDTLGLTLWNDAKPGPKQTAFSLTTGAALVASKGSNAAGARTPTDPNAWPDPTYQRNPVLDIDNVSRAGEKKSHAPSDPRYGVNCMRCHQEHGPGIGQFTAAGTLLDAAGKPGVGAKVEVFSADSVGYAKFENLVSKVVLDVDQNGNFFTTAPLGTDTTPVGARVLGADGQPVITMPFTQQTAACNNCHIGGMRLTLPAGMPTP